MRSRTPVAVAAAALLVLTGASACSSSTSTSTSSSSSAAPSAEATPNGVQDLDAKQILEKSRAAAGAASSVKVVVVQDNQGTEVRTDLTLSDQGSTGTLGQPDGQNVEVIGTPDTIFVKGGPFAQSLGAENAAALEGKWLSIPKDNPAAQSFAGLSSVKEFVDTTLATPEDLKKLPPKDVDGTQAVGLESAQGTLWIATQGEPYPVQITAPKGQSGALTLSDWNAPVTITPPPADQVVDISTLQQATPTAAPVPTEVPQPEKSK